MFTNAINFLRDADQFGATYKPSMKSKSSSYKTVIGGILTIMVYGISLAYIMYEFVLWQNGELLPKVTTIKKSLKEFGYTFQDLAKFHLRNHFQEEFIDPFNPEEIIIQPMIYKVIDGLPTDPTPIQSESNEIVIKNLYIKLIEDSNQSNPSIDYMIAFQKCQEKYLFNEGTKCASDEKINKFFEQKANQLVVKNYVQQYNTSTRVIEVIEDSYLVAFDQNIVYFSQCAYDVSQISVDEGLILESWEDFQFPTNIEHIVQQMDVEYFKKYLGIEAYLIFQFEIGVIQEHIMVEYPKVSEIMANVGSIISFFFFFSYIALIVSESQLEQEAIRYVIEMYYPQIKEVKIISTCFGRMKEVIYQENRLDVEAFKIKYQELSEVAREKLTILNQIYEVSRLQFLIQSLINKEQIKQIHKSGIKLKILQQEIPKQVNSNFTSKEQEDESIQNDLEKNNKERPDFQQQKIQNFKYPLDSQLQTLQNTLFLNNQTNNLDEPLEYQLQEDDFSLLIRSQQQQILKDKEEIQLEEVREII